MGNRVLTVEDLTHGYNGRTLFRNAKLDVEKGERIAIIGPNGAGAQPAQRRLPCHPLPQYASA